MIKLPRTINPTERRKKLIEDFNRQRSQKSSPEFEPINRFNNEKAVKQFDKWYSSTTGGTNFEK